jgi:hypothetical protein
VVSSSLAVVVAMRDVWALRLMCDSRVACLPCAQDRRVCGACHRLDLRALRRRVRV